MKREEGGEADRDDGGGEDYGKEILLEVLSVAAEVSHIGAVFQVESDDATIDQEFSSLTSYEEPAAESRAGGGAARSLSSVEDATAGNANGRPDFPPRFSNNDAVPSWAANADSDEEELPRTVFERKSAAAALDGDDYGDGESSSREEAESRPVGRAKSPVRADWQIGLEIGTNSIHYME